VVLRKEVPFAVEKILFKNLTDLFEKKSKNTNGAIGKIQNLFKLSQLWFYARWSRNL